MNQYGLFRGGLVSLDWVRRPTTSVPQDPLWSILALSSAVSIGDLGLGAPVIHVSGSGVIL